MPGPLVNQTPRCIFRESLKQCSNDRGSKDFRVCADCPRWSLDLIYEDVYGRQVEQTYLWWRYEWIMYGHSYAKDRMLELVEKPPHLRRIVQSKVPPQEQRTCAVCCVQSPLVSRLLVASIIVMALVGVAVLYALVEVLITLS